MNFDAVSQYRVLMIGDAIYDKYVFVRPLGKSMKESVLSVGYEREEKYHGGVWAAAKHLEWVVSDIDVIYGRRVLINTRFVEGSKKLFTLHETTDEPAYSLDEVDVSSYDLVIVADFGHGTMTPAAIRRVSAEARFLAVNAQTNSSNFGFNLITKYPRADYVVIDELEARLAAHDNCSPIEDVIRSLGYGKIVVTLGSNGAIGFDGEFHREKARAEHVVDTMGAGDAVLAVSSPFAAAGYSIQDLVRIGNMAGAAKVGVLGHQRAVRREDLKEKT
jgi:sugar/nucleoside kinase (ribokinase family)